MEAAGALAEASGAGILGAAPVPAGPSVAAVRDARAGVSAIAVLWEAPSAVPTIAAIRNALAAVPVCADGPGMIDQLRELEDLKSAVAAKQAQIAVAFDLSQRREQAATGVPGP